MTLTDRLSEAIVAHQATQHAASTRPDDEELRQDAEKGREEVVTLWLERLAEGEG